MALRSVSLTHFPPNAVFTFFFYFYTLFVQLPKRPPRRERLLSQRERSRVCLSRCRKGGERIRKLEKTLPRVAAAAGVRSPSFR